MHGDTSINDWLGGTRGGGHIGGRLMGISYDMSTAGLVVRIPYDGDMIPTKRNILPLLPFGVQNTTICLCVGMNILYLQFSSTHIHVHSEWSPMIHAKGVAFLAVVAEHLALLLHPTL